jgi:hypothetical protein
VHTHTHTHTHTHSTRTDGHGVREAQACALTDTLLAFRERETIPHYHTLTFFVGVCVCVCVCVCVRLAWGGVGWAVPHRCGQAQITLHYLYRRDRRSWLGAQPQRSANGQNDTQSAPGRTGRVRQPLIAPWVKETAGACVCLWVCLWVGGKETIAPTAACVSDAAVSLALCVRVCVCRLA